MFGSLYVYTYKLPEILVSLYVRTNLLIFQEMISRFPRKFVRSKKFRSRPISGFPRKFVRLIKFRSRPISGTTGRSHLGGGCCYYLSHSFSLSFSLSLSFSCSLSLSLVLFLSPSLSFSRSLSHSLALSLALFLSLSFSLLLYLYLHLRFRRKWFWVNSGSEKVRQVLLPCPPPSCNSPGGYSCVVGRDQFPNIPTPPIDK